MNHALMATVIVLGTVCGLGSVQSSAEDEQPAFDNVWICSPQVCRGKPWSSTGKAAGWSVVAENEVCRVSADDGSMIASVSPMEGGRFIATVALEMQQRGAIIQLFLDEIALDLSDDGQTIRVAGGPEFLRFSVERKKGQRWSILRVDRKQNTLSVTLNDKEVVRFDDQGRSYEQVGLKPIGGTTDVSRFTLTGHLTRPPQPDAKPVGMRNADRN